MSPLISAAMLIVHVIFDPCIVILLLRFILQKLDAGWSNPLSQFIFRVTEKPLKPLQKFLPTTKRFDLSVLVLAFVLQLIAVFLFWVLQFAPTPNVPGIVVITFSELLSKFVYIYLYGIIINALLSWIPQIQAHSIASITYTITDPILSLIRRVVPPIAGVDISPIFALLGLTLINMLVVGPILNLGAKLIFG